MFELRELPEFSEWLLTLKDRSAKARIRVRLLRLQSGHFGDVRPIGAGLSELRIDLGPGYRIYLKKIDNLIIVLLCAGDKDTQPSDIQRALELVKNLED